MTDKCPRCGEGYRCDFDSEDDSPASRLFNCGTFVYADGNIADGWSCLHHQRDALRAEVVEHKCHIAALESSCETYRAEVAEQRMYAESYGVEVIELRAEVVRLKDALRVSIEQGGSLMAEVAALKQQHIDRDEWAAAKEDEIASLRAKLARYEGPLTKEQIRAVSMELTTIESVAEHDAAIRKVRGET